MGFMRLRPGMPVKVVTTPVTDSKEKKSSKAETKDTAPSKAETKETAPSQAAKK